nr:reverse transcriptase domain-containing protein [Tanacetum cinerariifolium]
MSAMANTTPIVTTVTKLATNPRDADATPRVNIHDLCGEYYEDILPIIMDKVRRDKRKEVHARLDFGESFRERRTREDSHHSSARALTTRLERLKVRDRLRYGGRTKSRDYPRGRNRPYRLDTSNEGCPEDRELFRGIGESYDDSYSQFYHDRDCSRYMKRRRDNESPLSSVSKSDSSDGRYRKSKSKRHKSTDEDDLTRPWMCEEEDPFTPRIQFHNIKQKDEETIKDFMEQFKVETGRMKGVPECMRISRFMHRVNNQELTKRLNEHVSKTMEEMMIATTAFIRGEAAAASKKRSHIMENTGRVKKANFRKEEILAAKAGKFQSPPPMVTPVEKRRSNKVCDFHNDKRHSTDECMQLKKQIEELVRAGKLSHLIKEIKHGRDQSKVGKKETPTKDKPAAIYMIQSWQRMTRQKVTQNFERVREITFPPLTTSSGAEGPLVIEAIIGGHMIHRMYVDGGSSMKILYEHCFNRLRPEVKNQIVPATTSLTGFSGETIWPLGQLRLLVTIGDADHSTRAWMNFMESLSPYNGVIGRSGIKEIQAVPSTTHGMLKFPVDGGIVTIRSTILIPVECATVITSSAVPKEVGARPENFKVALHPDFPDQEVAIGGTFSMKGRTELCSLLKENLNIFAWQPSDMTRLPRSVAEHQLNIQEGYSPVRQRKRGQAPERAKAIQAEVQKLVEAGIMREVYYHDWLSNPVMVKKHDGSWRMYVDFTDLNKAYPQDCYPLSEIDSKVESLCGYPFKCFLDAYKGYHQIQLAESDEEKKAFHTGQGVYCYTKMPFGLKNAGATYRLVDKAFDSQIGRNIEVYVNDLVVKSHTEAEMLRDIGETFRTLRKINMKLNPKKSKRLQRYFQAHPIAVITDQPIKQIMSRPNVAGRLQKWSVMLEEHNITYRPRTSVKGQVLADFLAEMPDETQMGVQNIHVSVDSKLAANQVLGTYVAKEENIIKYLEKVKSLVTTVVEEDGPTWMTPIMEYLKEGTLPSDRNEERMLRIKARQYELLEGVLYRRSFLTPWLRYVGPLQTEYVIKEIHKGSCSMHAGPRLEEGIKARLGEGNKNWVEELPHVLWAHRTMIKSSHGDTPFSLTCGTEAVIPEEIGMPTYRTATVDVVYNDEELRLNLDLIEERRERTLIRKAKAKLKMTKYYNLRFRGVTFKPGDFVYRSNDASHAVYGVKLGSKWEGPYEVKEELGDGAYKLQSTDGTVIPRT